MSKKLICPEFRNLLTLGWDLCGTVVMDKFWCGLDPAKETEIGGSETSVPGWVALT